MKNIILSIVVFVSCVSPVAAQSPVPSSTPPLSVTPAPRVVPSITPTPPPSVAPSQTPAPSPSPLPPVYQNWCQGVVDCLYQNWQQSVINQYTIGEMLLKYPDPPVTPKVVGSDILWPIAPMLEIVPTFAMVEYMKVATEFLQSGGNLTLNAARILWNLSAQTLALGSRVAACKALEAAMPPNNELWRTWMAILVKLPNLCK